MLKFETVKMVDCHELDMLVRETYKRPYTFQQQYGCQPRGVVHFTVPDHAEDFENDTVEETVNGPEEGVSFKAWLERDPAQPLSGQERDYQLGLWWDRNFYPDTQTVLNDLHAKGLVPAGSYTINIDW